MDIESFWLAPTSSGTGEVDGPVEERLADPAECNDAPGEASMSALAPNGEAEEAWWEREAKAQQKCIQRKERVFSRWQAQEAAQPKPR